MQAYKKEERIKDTTRGRTPRATRVDDLCILAGAAGTLGASLQEIRARLEAEGFEGYREAVIE